MNVLRIKPGRTVCCIGTTIALGAAVLGVLPALAQNANADTRVPVGPVHRWEANLDKQLTTDYNAGLIDTFELANLRRDLNGIKTQEEQIRMDNGGLSVKAEACIMGKLDRFQTILQRSTADKVCISVQL